MYIFFRHLLCLLLIIGFSSLPYKTFSTPKKCHATLSWKGGAPNDGKNWFNANNWEPTMVPDELQDIIIDANALNDCVISGGKKAKCHSLVLTNRTLWVDNALDSLEISGNLTLAGGILNMTNGGVLMIYRDWQDQWTTNGFVAGKSEVIWKGNTLQNLNSNTKILFYNFTLDCQVVDLQTSIEISGNFSLKKGLINTYFKPDKHYMLTLDVHAYLGEMGLEGTGGNNQSFVNGPMEWKVQDTNIHYLPVGNGIYYAPIAVSPQDNSPKIYRAEYYPVGFGAYNIETSDTIFMSRICSNEYWTLLTFPINGSVITNDDAKVRLQWRFKTGLPFVGDRKDVFVARYASDSWSAEGYQPFVEDKGAQWGTVESDIFVSAFGSFTFGSKSGLIPVSFINFEGSVTEVFEVLLKWQMGEYGKTKRFIVERSIDEVSFSTIGILDSNTLTNVNNIYDFTDKFPVEGYNYYRVKQIGKNGSYNYSQTIAIFLELGGFPTISALYPNPVENVLNINMEYYVPENGEVKAEILLRYETACAIVTVELRISKAEKPVASQIEILLCLLCLL